MNGHRRPWGANALAEVGVVFLRPRTASIGHWADGPTIVHVQLHIDLNCLGTRLTPLHEFQPVWVQETVLGVWQESV